MADGPLNLCIPFKLKDHNVALLFAQSQAILTTSVPAFFSVAATFYLAAKGGILTQSFDGRHTTELVYSKIRIMFQSYCFLNSDKPFGLPAFVVEHLASTSMFAGLRPFISCCNKGTRNHDHDMIHVTIVELFQVSTPL